MPTAKLITLGNGEVRAILYKFKVRSTDSYITFSAGTDLLCPNCMRSKLEIGDENGGYLQCETCGKIIRCVKPNLNYCYYCGAPIQNMLGNVGEVTCSKCSHVTNISEQEISLLEKTYSKTRKCAMCGAYYVTTNNDTNLCTKCNNGMKREMAQQAEDDYLTTLDDFGFHDDNGGYHRYDED